MLELATIRMIITGLDILLIQAPGVDKEPHRHVWIIRRLMFPKVHIRRYNKGNVVLHPHIYGIIECIEPDILWVGVACPIHRVIQGKRPLLILRIAENEFEQAILVFSIHVFLVSQ